MIVGLLAGYRSVLVLSAILSIFGTGLGLVPYLAAWRIAVAIQGAGIDAGELVYWTVLAVCALITKALLQAGATTLSHVAAYRILYQLRHRLVEKLARVPLGVLSGTTSGHLRKIVMEDVEQIEEGIAHAIPDLAARTFGSDPIWGSSPLGGLAHGYRSSGHVSIAAWGLSSHLACDAAAFGCLCRGDLKLAFYFGPVCSRNQGDPDVSAHWHNSRGAP